MSPIHDLTLYAAAHPWAMTAAVLLDRASARGNSGEVSSRYFGAASTEKAPLLLSPRGGEASEEPMAKQLR